MIVEQYLSEYSIQLEEVIGSGAFGVVVKGYDTYNKRNVAIKLIINQNPEKKKELEDEIKILRKISSDYVIKIYEQFYNEESSCFIIVMEYCNNGDLHSYFNKKKNLEREEIINIFTKFLIGLQDIHKKGIIHSDLKPQNILLSEGYQPKICDLGLSKVLQNDKQITSNKGGTPLYSSYEQMCGQVRLESDYYSSGSILCFLCGLQLEDNFMMAFQLKNGVFPNIEDKKFKDLIQIGFQMMQFDPVLRKKPEEVYNELINMVRKPLITRSQKESDDKKEIKNGIWIYYLNNGDKYEGNFKDDKYHGYGIFYQNEGNKYEGEWLNDYKNGKGIYYFKSGGTYEGELKNDMFHGQGTHYLKNGEKYVGQWENDKRSGEGTYYFSGGNKYVGQWLNDKRNGKGIFYYVTGDRYEGEFKDGKRNGEGILYHKNGDKEQGIWKDNKQEKSCTIF